jgi:16S rRNA (adenine1518-N6/adenine1519-N6)-dimethyltransferase
MKANKSLGQHWLFDETSLLAICEAAGLKQTDTVLEIGPGLGSLTRYLVEQAKAVTAVELDRSLIKGLMKNLKAKNLKIINEDILKFDFEELPKNYKLIANIPYYLTSNLIRKISETSNPPSKVALLVQKEVAQRIAASPGQMSLLSVTSQFYWQVTLGQIVESYLFEPPPKVDSQIVILDLKDDFKLNQVEQDKLFRVVRAGFSQRRKTLANSLSAGLSLDRKLVETICLDNNIDPTRRAQTLSLDEWLKLYEKII